MLKFRFALVRLLFLFASIAIGEEAVDCHIGDTCRMVGTMSVIRDAFGQGASISTVGSEKCFSVGLPYARIADWTDIDGAQVQILGRWVVHDIEALAYDVKFDTDEFRVVGGMCRNTIAVLVQEIRTGENFNTVFYDRYTNLRNGFVSTSDTN